MDDIAIRVEGLSKCYRIQQGARAHYSTLRDTLVEAVRAPFHRRSSPDFAGNDSYIWALKDVSFEVKRGEVVGIIGRNGAGKTTLLKILSRITEPTEGYAEVRGRVGSLLEVGTGFHPELTGRENIYLNGAILGMKKAEIDRKFDEIVAFAEVEKFIDTPVKFYSSGMYVRLAFAVAAHLDPEILLVDEVLAVGDAAFQKKCLGKMGDVAKEGRTVLFVSHNIGQIRRLCERGICLDNGAILYSGSIDETIARYQIHIANISQSSSTHQSKPAGFLEWRLVGSRLPYVYEGGPVTLQVKLSLNRPVKNAFHSLVLQTADGENVAGWGFRGVSFAAGCNVLLYRLPYLPIRPGIYYWYASLWDPRKVDVYVFPQELLVSTQDHSNLETPWSGFLNIPCEFWSHSEETANADESF
jgi:ABC-type polysaccharide/polyol phosphate transport system ATPase subunit